MKFYIQQKLVIHTLSLTMIILLFMPTMTYAAWKTTEFKVRNSTDVDKVTVQKLEKILQEVAKTYESYGFKEPNLERQYGTGKYIVYLNNSSEDPRDGFYGWLCTEGNELHFMTSVLSQKNKKYSVDPKAYAVLAHELFHAIQNSYPLFRSSNNCKIGDWIIEGTATAIGEDIAIQLTKGKYKLRPDLLGIRSYQIPLRIPNTIKINNKELKKRKLTHNVGHYTSGFWRYIGEFISNNGKPSSKKLKLADYRYLVKLFEKNVGSISENDELKWLDSGLRNNDKVRISLDQMYANFITTFAFYVPDREKGTGLGWRVCLFSGINCLVTNNSNIKVDPCKVYAMAIGSEQEISLDIDKTASACFKIKLLNPNVKKRKEIGFDLDIKNIEKQFMRIKIGTKVYKNKKISFDVQSGITPINNSQKVLFTSWKFELTPENNGEQIFVVSNFADTSRTRNKGTFIIKANIPRVIVNEKE